MEKTLTIAEEKLSNIREGVATGVEESRDRAADALERAGGALRSGSRRAGRSAERTGDRLGKTMQRQARELRPRRSRGVLGYLRRHPLQALLLLGLATGVVAVAFIPRLARRMDEYGGYEDFGQAP
jgi:hypothetical protein